MKLPQNLRSIVDREYQKSSKELYRLTRRKGERPDTRRDWSTEVLPIAEQEAVLAAWDAFHQALNHASLNTISSKIEFCRSDMLKTLEEQRFLQLIADRTFLFLEYNEHRNNPQCPSLRKLCAPSNLYRPERLKTEFRQCAKDAAKALTGRLERTETQWLAELETAFADWEKQGESVEARGPLDTFFCRRWHLDEEAGEALRQCFAHFREFCTALQNAKTVLRQGFVPTVAHRADLEELQRNEQRLREALKRRRAHWVRCGLTPGADAVLPMEQFQVKIQPHSGNPTPEAEALSKLFHAYLKATHTYAYKRDYGPYLDGNPDWTAEMSQVLEEIESQGRQADRRLILYYLFTRRTTKLAAHTLRKFKIDKPLPGKMAASNIKPTQSTVTHRNECNVLLFDHLMRCFPPEDVAYEKFRFYLLTHYEGYVHYKITWPKEGSEMLFDFVPNWDDGVDELGNLLRNHIAACIPNRMEWLTPDLRNSYRDVAVELVTRLLYDAEITAAAFRLTNRIRSFLRDEESKWLYDEYAKHQNDTSAVEEELSQICRDKNFVFYLEKQFHTEMMPRKNGDLVYGRFLLEFELREELIKQVRIRLLRRAEQLFSDCFCVEDPFFLA